jgi:hypothetical protein
MNKSRLSGAGPAIKVGILILAFLSTAAIQWNVSSDTPEAVSPLPENPMPLIATPDSRLNIGIVGEGYFEVTMPDGWPGFTRYGAFKLEKGSGQWLTSEGWAVNGNFTPIATGTTDISISADGLVHAFHPTSGVSSFGISLTRFANPAGLETVPGYPNYFKVTGPSGPPIEGNPGRNGFGFIAQGFLESVPFEIRLTGITRDTNRMAHAAFDITNKNRRALSLAFSPWLAVWNESSWTTNKSGPFFTYHLDGNSTRRFYLPVTTPPSTWRFMIKSTLKRMETERTVGKRYDRFSADAWENVLLPQEHSHLVEFSQTNLTIRESE